MNYLDLFLKGEPFPSSFQIYIRKSELTKTDEDIFNQLGWNDYTKIENHDSDYLDELGDYFCVTECENWIHLIDSSWCPLYYKIIDNPNEIKEFEGLEIFKEVFGFFFYFEMIDEYAFYYIRDGILKRYYRLYQLPGTADKLYNTHNIGEPMPGERPECRTDDGIEYLSAILEALNITIDTNLENARLYKLNDLEF